MEAMRERWTDERMDDLNRKVDELGRRVDNGFNRVEARFERMETRSNASILVSKPSNPK
jgi:hypothetical protein